MKRRSWRRPAAVCLAAVAASCGGQPDDLRAYLDEVKARPGVPLEPLPVVREPDLFVYEPAGRRSPFEPALPGTGAAPQAAAGPGPDPDRERDFLEHYSLDALRMVGSVSTGPGRFGLILTPDGLVHRVAMGDYLGRNHGRVVGISAREVRIVELVANGIGGYVERPAAVVLAD